MIFVGDESVDLPVLQTLAALGHEVLVVALRCPGISDQAVLELAQARSALLITCDKDFGQLVVSEGQRCAGVVLVRLPSYCPVGMADRVREAFLQSGDRWPGSFVVIQDQQIRVRPLILPDP